MRRHNEVGHIVRFMPETAASRFYKTFRLVVMGATAGLSSSVFPCFPVGTAGQASSGTRVFFRRVRPEGVFDQLATRQPNGFIDHALAFRLRLVGSHVGLRGRANVELQPPTATPADLAAP